MKMNEYPALYQSADVASLRAQKVHFGFLKANGVALLAASGAAMLVWISSIYGWIAAIFFVTSTILSIIMLVKRFDVEWYKARALAESVKTTTWRYMMGADPFQLGLASQEVNRLFLDRLAKIIKDNKQVTGRLIERTSGDQITDKMRNIRRSSLVERKLFYLENRIKEQRRWYGDNAKSNGHWSTVFFVFLIAFQILAVATSIASTLFIQWKIWPTYLLALVASLILGWIQSKRFSELSASYALAAHEIGFLEITSDSATTDEEFSVFILDAEGAFSREHTQWVAQRE